MGGAGLNSKQQKKAQKSKDIGSTSTPKQAVSAATTPPAAATAATSTTRESLGQKSGGSGSSNHNQGSGAAPVAGASNQSQSRDPSGFTSPLYSSAAASARTRASSGVWTAPLAEGGNSGSSNNAGAGTPGSPGPSGASAQPTPNPPSASASTNSKMDVQDFIRAIELDDVFLQVIISSCVYVSVCLY
jgi:hypothetical protein